METAGIVRQNKGLLTVCAYHFLRVFLAIVPSVEPEDHNPQRGVLMTQIGILYLQKIGIF